METCRNNPRFFVARNLFNRRHCYSLTARLIIHRMISERPYISKESTLAEIFIKKISLILKSVLPIHLRQSFRQDMCFRINRKNIGHGTIRKKVYIFAIKQKYVACWTVVLTDTIHLEVSMLVADSIAIDVAVLLPSNRQYFRF